MQPLFVVPWQRLPYGRDVFTYADSTDTVAIGDVVSVPLQGRQVHGVVLGPDPHPPQVSLSPIGEVTAPQWFTKQQLELLQWISSEYATSLSTLCYLYGVAPDGELAERPKRKNGAAAKLEPDSSWLGADRVVLEVGSDASVGSAILPLLQRWAGTGKPLLVLCPTQRRVEAVASLLSRRLPLDVQYIHGGTTRTGSRQVWRRCLGAEPVVTVGTAAAAALPFSKLGGVALVDEADSASKAIEGRPLVHLRSLALRCAEVYGAPCCLADRTPSLAAYAMASAQRWRAARVGQPPDLSKLTVREPHGKIDERSLQEVRDTLARGETVLVLVPRRGEGGLLRCADCSHSPTCPSCGLPYAVPGQGSLRCRYCRRTARVPARCERCRGVNLRPKQPTTQSVAQEVSAALPGAKVATFEAGQRAPGPRTQVVVATAAALYQLDLASFGLRLAVSFDTYLQQSDFSSAERAYRLLRQLMATGQTTVESAVPSHQTFASAGNWLNFCRQELALRKKFELPPVFRYAKLSIDSEDEQPLRSAVDELTEQLKASRLDFSGPTVVPGRSPRRRHRRVWLIRVGSDADLERLAELDYTTTTLDPDPVDFS